MDDPNWLTELVIISGFFKAWELMETLSAPDLKIFSISSILLKPPPTVIGINTLEVI